MLDFSSRFFTVEHQRHFSKCRSILSSKYILSMEMGVSVKEVCNTLLVNAER
jgi:hypothetical protein